MFINLLVNVSSYGNCNVDNNDILKTLSEHQCFYKVVHYGMFCLDSPIPSRRASIHFPEQSLECICIKGFHSVKSPRLKTIFW